MRVPFRVLCRSCGDRAAVRSPAEHVSVVTANRGADEYPPYRFAASSAGVEVVPQPEQTGRTKEPGKHAGRIFDYATPLELRPTDDPVALGEAVHAILLLTVGRSAVPNEAEVKAILSYFGVTEAAAASAFMQRAGEFLNWLKATWPGASYDLETSGYAKENDILTSARIDLLLETDREIVILDHKTLVEVNDVEEAAATYAAQLAVYGKVVQKATARGPIRTMVHLPVQGKAVEINA